MGLSCALMGHHFTTMNGVTACSYCGKPFGGRRRNIRDDTTKEND